MTQLSNLESQLLQRLRCSVCGGSLAVPGADTGDGDITARCIDCAAIYPRKEGIWRMLSAEEQDRYRSFLEGYPAVRLREGRERDEAYFLALPEVPPSDPTAFEWSIRRRSLAVLDRLLAQELAKTNEAERWALDLGAGNGWLSRHLTLRGYRTVALDLTVGGLDSLAGAALYIKREGIWLGRVQASMSGLPLQSNVFSLCTVSASLHYAALEETLESIHRVLEPGGLLAITDSPVYRDPEAGRAMVAEREARLGALLGAQPPDLPGGQNFLVEADVVALMAEAGFSVRVISIEHPLNGPKRALTRILGAAGRERARFPVIVGRKA